jgi:hypothetical protein
LLLAAVAAVLLEFLGEVQAQVAQVDIETLQLKVYQQAQHTL